MKFILEVTAQVELNIDGIAVAREYLNPDYDVETIIVSDKIKNIAVNAILARKGKWTGVKYVNITVE